MVDFFGGLGVSIHKAMAVNVDNQGAIALAKNPVFHNRSKHIDIQYHYTCGFVKVKKIQLEYILTSKGVCQRPCGPCTDHRARAVAWTAVFY